MDATLFEPFEIQHSSETFCHVLFSIRTARLNDETSGCEFRGDEVVDAATIKPEHVAKPPEAESLTGFPSIRWL